MLLDSVNELHQPFPWQQPQWRHFLSSYSKGTLPHALLLGGPSGMGKLIYARAIAERLLCTANEEYACGKCRSCQLIKAKTHPDFMLLQPENDGKAIKVDQIRALVDALSRTSQQQGYQVVIIEPAEAMNRSAVNALLKTLEEPQGQVMIILVVHRLADIPATLLSRCQQVQFSITKYKPVVIAWLQEQLAIDAAEADHLLTLAENIPLRAVNFASQNLLQLRNKLIEDLLLLRSHKIDPITFVARHLGTDMANFIHCLTVLIMDMIRIKFNLTQNALVNRDQFETLHQLSQHNSLQQLFHSYAKLILLTQLLTKQSNVNMQMQLESFFIDWFEAIGCRRR